MGRRQFANRRSSYRASKDVGLYVFSDNDALIENVNSVLKRKGIIGVTDPSGMVRYYIDGRKDISNAANRLQTAVTDFKDSPYEKEEYDMRQLYDLAAHRVFLDYDFDMSLIGSNIIYQIVCDVIQSGFSFATTLKEMCSAQNEDFVMSYSQMVRNIRYSFSHSKLSHMRSKSAVMFLAVEVYNMVKEMER